MRTSALFLLQKKLRMFRNLWCFRTNRWGFSQCGQGGSIFRDFVPTSFMDGPKHKIGQINCRC